MHDKFAMPGTASIDAPTRFDRMRRAAPWLIVVIVIGCYANSIPTPFQYDDRLIIKNNLSLRTLWPIWTPMFPPATSWTAGRPLTGLTLAINYAIDGLNPRGYHLGNVALHLLASLTLFGVLRRLFKRAAYPHADNLAAAVAILWTAHPLLTESVTYAANRSEVQMGLFFLLAVYTFLRSADSATPRRWLAISVACALLSTGSKEVGAMLPAVVLVIDALFISRSWKEPFKRRWAYYAALLLVAAIVPIQLHFASIQTKIVLGNQKLTSWQYLLMQSQVITHYLRLTIWPSPLVISYIDWPVPASLIDVLPWMAGIGALVLLSTYAIARRRSWGMIGAWFFLILAPTSSFLPIAAEPAAERRMYLPSIAVIVAIVLLAERFLRRLPRSVAVAVVCCTVIALGVATIGRNRDYATPLRMWTDAVAKRPGNWAAQSNLGVESLNAEGWAGALARFDLAIRLKPDFGRARTNRGMCLIYLGRTDEGIAELKEGARLQLDKAESWSVVGRGLQLAGRAGEAGFYFQKALELDPNDSTALQLSRTPVPPLARSTSNPSP